MSSSKKLPRVEGRVRDVVQSGDAVIETQAGLVFARGALHGERVLLALEPKAGRVQRARVLDVLEPSAARVEAPCRYVVRCGGCPLMHASINEQRALKLRFLRDALVKAGAPGELDVHMTTSDRVLGYRRRARLAFQVARGARKLGFRRERSHDLEVIEHCIVMEPALDRAHGRLRERVLPVIEGEGEVSLSLGRRGAAVVVISSAQAQPPALYAACEALVDGDAIEGVALFAAGATKPAMFGDATEWGEGFDAQPLEGSVGGFSQAHREINLALVERVRELAKTEGARALELYAGHGNLTVALAAQAASYVAVEQDAHAVAALRRNLSLRALKAKVIEGDVSKQLAGGPLDVVVLDPPRTGAPSVLSSLAARKPKRIVYVSCDPATLARDVHELLPTYRIAWAEAFDMFPQTADLESVVLLERI